jgi:PAS domain S-box-containing protein/putative nucleotidyltransferase with HDIG domain
LEEVFIRLDGKPIDVEVSATPFLYAGKPAMLTVFTDISERKRTTEANKLAYSQLANLYNTLPEAIFSFDVIQNKMLQVSPANEAVFGYSLNEFMQNGQAWYENILPQDKPMVDAGYPLLLEGKTIKHQFRILRPDGKTRWIEGIIKPNLDGNGNLVRLDGISTDITERKQAEQALQESEERYRQLLEFSPDAIVVHSKGKFVFLNPAAVHIYGAKNAQELLGKPMLARVHPDYRNIVKKRLSRTSKGKIAGLLEQKFVRLDGSVVDVEVTAIPFTYQGAPAVQMVVRDITQRKKSEQLVRDSEKRFRAIFDQAPIGVALVDTQGHPIISNTALSQMVGYSEDELSKMKFTDFTHPEDIDKDVEQFTDLKEGKITTYSMEKRYIHKNGKVVWGNLLVTLLRDENGMQQDIFGMVVNISERKRAEDAIRLSEEKYRTLVDDVNDGFYVTDDAGVFTLANPALARMMGMQNHEELLGRKFFDFVAPETAAQLGQAYSSAMQSGNAEKIINGQIVHPDGTKAFIEVKPSMIVKAGQIVGTQGVVRDVTERRQADRRIQRQLEHLLALSSIDRLIASNFDLNLSLSEILSYVIKELGVDAADILLLNPDSLMLEFGAERGFRTKAIRNGRVRLGESYAGRAALERQLVQISNMKDETDKLFQKTHLAGEDFVCYYGMPLIAKGQVKGVLEIYHRSVLEPDAEWLNFMNSLAGQAAIAIENSTLFENLQRSNSELGMAYDATIEGWSHALDLRDKETEGHTQRVTAMTLKLARQFNLCEADLLQIRWGALLHDIGKMGVPDGILLKPGPLTDEEWVAMKKHPGFAYEMLSPIHYLRNALDIPYCHHEKWDGSGYPRGLKGNQIPLAARIFAVVDVWDALKSDRPYRPSWTEEKVREHIQSLSGTHFDPQVVDAFLSLTK